MAFIQNIYDQTEMVPATPNDFYSY